MEKDAFKDEHKMAKYSKISFANKNKF